MYDDTGDNDKKLLLARDLANFSRRNCGSPPDILLAKEYFGALVVKTGKAAKKIVGTGGKLPEI